MTSELLVQATKYRAVARSLSPTMQGPQGRDYYFARADELERQARGVVVARAAAAGGSPPIPPPLATPPPPAPAITLKKMVYIHTILAVAVMQDKRANIHRAFTLWLTLRQQARRYFDKSDVIEFYATQTGKHPRNVRRWLDAGDGVFWTFGRKNRLSLIGKDKVFGNYQLATPGVVLLVDTEKLLGKLQDARAAIYGCWLGGKNSKWASRATIRKITGVSGRSQLNYDQANKQHKQKIFAVDWRTENGKSRQLPNKYHAVFYPANSGHQGNKKRYGLYTPDKQWGELSPSENLGASSSHCLGKGLTVGGGRVLFDNPNKAVAAALRRQKQGIDGQCFAVIGDTKRGNLLVKTLDYGAIA